jgi:hypothetical protein
VDLLEDRDAGVRLFAIQGLARLCGSDYGYRYYAAERERAGAVRRWRDALRDGQVTVRPPVSAERPAEEARGEAASPANEATDSPVQSRDAGSP